MAVAKSQIESEKLEFEREKFRKENEFKAKELELREKEIDQNRIKVTPAQVAIIVSLLGIFGTLVATYIQNDGNQKLEKYKFESNLILKVMTTDSLQRNKENLRFLVNAGLITDNIKIQNVLKDPRSSLKIRDSHLTPSDVMRGIVLNEENKPVPNAIVRVIGVFECKTDSGGYFHFSILGVEQGTKVLSVTKKGFKTRTASVDIPGMMIVVHLYK